MAESSTPGKVVDKRDLYRKVLRRKRTFLLENLTDIDGILDHLQGNDILTDDIKYRDIKDAMTNRTTTEAIRLLLDTVVSVSDKHYETFLAILKEMKMEFVHNELCKAEDDLAKEPPEDIVEKVQDMSLKDKSKEVHYDICILYEDQDRDLAITVKEKLEEIDYKADEPVKIILYDDEDVSTFESKSDRLRRIWDTTTMQFYIVPKFEMEDKNVTWDRDSLILQGVRDHKATVRVLLTEKSLREKLDISLANLQEIKWYNCDLDDYKGKILKLLNILKGKRPHVVKKHKNT